MADDKDLRANLNDKAMDERIARFIQNQAEYSVVEEVNDYKEQLFAELKNAQENRFAELEEHFKELGITAPVPYEGQRYPGGGYPYYHGDYYGRDPYYRGRKGDKYYGHPYGYNPYHHVEPYQGKDSNTKYLDEHPQQEWQS